jgi:hypothetical protein
VSRAFMKESEQSEPRCPGCQTLGDAVGLETLEAHVSPDDQRALGDKAFYCATSACATAYFNGWGTRVPRDRMVGTSYPKDPEGPICPCFGLRATDIIADARAGLKERVGDLRRRSEGPEARCSVRCPDGQCCIPRVFRLFRETYETR